MKKSLYAFLLIFLLSLFTTYKAFMAYGGFHQNNIPVYDGVMYEKKQIMTYMKFENNFSLIERINQAYYEFKGNGLNPGFNCAVVLVNPHWLVNDTDVILRGFFSVFIFSLVLFNYLRYRTSLLNSLIIITLFFQLPLFYNFRCGLTSYIPEISSALLLLGGYVQMLNFFKSGKSIQFITACILIITSIMSRMNFIVYAFFFMLPLLYKMLSTIKVKPFKIKIGLVFFVICCITFLALYIYEHIDFFIGYYKPEIPYAEQTYSCSFYYLFQNFNEQIGIAGSLVLLLILIISNGASENRNVNRSDVFYILYPFLFHFSFIILYIKACNVPHVIAAMMIFFSFLFIMPGKFFKNVSSKINNLQLRIMAIIVFVLLNVNFVFSYNSFKKTFPEYLGSKNVIEYIEDDKDFADKTYKYICFYDEMVEIPIDVALYKRSGIWLNSSDHFFVHDLFLSSISPSLSDSECIEHYIKRIENGEYNLIVINKSVNNAISFYKRAERINEAIKKYLLEAKNYYPLKIVSTINYGDLVLYKRKARNKMQKW